MDKSYIKRMISAIAVMPEHIYGGLEGRKRLAREIGGCLADSEPKEAKRQIGISYDSLLLGTSLNPCIDKKDWDAVVFEAYEKECDRRKSNRKLEV